MAFFNSPIWAFVSVVIVAWITQRIVSYRERISKIEESKRALYISWIPFFSEMLASAYFPTEPTLEPKERLKKRMEILATLQVMGPEDAMEPCNEFFEEASKSLENDASFDAKRMFRLFTEIHYQLCCEIHGERGPSKLERVIDFLNWMTPESMRRPVPEVIREPNEK